VTLLLGLAVTGFLFRRNIFEPMSFQEYYLLNTAMLLWVPMVAVLLFLRREPADFAFTPGDARGGLLAALGMFVLFLPVIWFVAPGPAFQTYYVRQLTMSGAITAGHIDTGRLLFHEMTLGFYMFAWEWYFRGFLLFGLKRIMPVVWAALFQACAFALLHYNKPWLEVGSSFLGALLLAGVALRFRSFLPCFVLHWAISAAFDGAVLYHHFNR
jgi:membrane protease YdiL (CAAX protease family)